MPKKSLQVSGFTLIEIMVTIAIMAIVTFVALPNFKNLGQSQQLTNSIDDIVGSLHAAQTDAQSGTICSNGSSSKLWAVSFVSTGFGIWSSCADGSISPSVLQVKNLASGLSIHFPTTVSSSSPISTCYVAFQGTSIAESSACSDTSLHDSGSLTIQIYNGTTCYKTVVIQSGGAIYASGC